MDQLPVPLKRKIRRWPVCVRVFIYSGLILTSILTIPKLFQTNVQTPEEVYNVDVFLEKKASHSVSRSSINCKNESALFLFIAVPSHAANFEQRFSIRYSWGSVAKSDPGLKLAFFVGISEDRRINDVLSKEKEIYNDIIEVKIEDKYEMLAKKSISIIEWIHNNCNHAKYYLKIDDDMFLNIRNLIDDLQLRQRTNSIIGCKVKDTSPFRFPFSKWYLSRDQYSADTFPDYISGPAYVITGDILSKLYFATKSVKYIFLEDVFINGICRRYIDAEAEWHPGFSCGYRDQGPCGTHFKNKITGHHYYPKEIERMWNELNDKRFICPLKHSYWISRIVDFFHL
ncbi:beta-1,3-galactosyltransferase 5-like [Saccostrea cucullata]|uniref:beta-1,3-galactosyltransferase 5-like n=1 Tax=Saccostrea cuccullata TaxID=36930 RepID=UPI002ED376CF